MSNFWKSLEKPITALAPMDDVTDFVFREIVTECAKPDVLFTEFVSADALCSIGRDIAGRKLLFSQRQRPIVAQIWGSNPQNFLEAAAFIEGMGFDGIDINMGCPHNVVMKSNSGASLINNTSLATKLIESVRKGAPNTSLSVKTRIASDGNSTRDWLSFLLSQPIDALTIHGRSPAAMYKGESDWEEIGKAIELRDKINPHVTLIGNGDVKSYKEIQEKHKTYGVDGVMIGRGIFQNPWIFETTTDPKTHSQKEHLDLLLRHLELFHNTGGEDKNYHIMKKYFKIYIRNFHGADALRARLMLTKGCEEAKKIICGHSYTPHQMEQVKIIDSIDQATKSADTKFEVITIPRDYENDPRIYLALLHFPGSGLKSKIHSEIIKPLSESFPDVYCTEEDGIHMTIKNVRTAKDPPIFSMDDVRTAEEVFTRVLSRHKAFSAYFYRLLLFPNSVSLVGTTDKEFDDIVLDSDDALKLNNLPDNKKYANTKHFFVNVTIARFGSDYRAKMEDTVREISDSIRFEPYKVDSATLVSGNLSLSKLSKFKSWKIKDY